MHEPTDKARQWNANGLSLVGAGKFAEAEACFRKAVELDREFPSAQNNLGATLVHLGRIEEAVPVLQEALRCDPENADAHHNLGFAIRNAGRPLESLPHFDRALSLRPDFPDALNNRGIALLELKRLADAEADFNAALRLNPKLALAHNNLGNALRDLGRSDHAVAAYSRAIQLQPDYADAYYNLGTLLTAQRHHDGAIACLQRTIALKPGFPLAHLNLGVALAGLRRRDEAIASFSKALELDPANALARAQRMHLLARNCAWDELESDIALLPGLGMEQGIVPPFSMLAFEDAPLRHLERAKRFAAATYRPQATAMPSPERRPDRLKIGYFSCDYTEHAVMQLAIALFENHDRERFSIHAFSYGPPADNEMRRRLVAAFDSFADVSAMTDEAIAARARADGIDIAVDLNGYTEGSRLGIFNHRAAPLQVTFLGHPGTTGAPFIDYLVADPVIVPKEWRQAYSEKLIVMPVTYQPNDRRAVAAHKPERAEAGLPEKGFVFSCFNNNYKITPREFDIWMRLLTEVEGSVLWLLATNVHVERNLRRQAERRGVDPQRLVFAPPRPMPEHLARHKLADLFLDTFAYNAHTTASDALWMGLPLLTRIGDGFAARVAASLLGAAGLDEMVTASDEGYAALALELARDPPRLAAIRKKLERTRDRAPLFDGAAFARGLEAGFDRAFERLVKGMPPADIRIG